MLFLDKPTAPRLRWGLVGMLTACLVVVAGLSQAAERKAYPRISAQRWSDQQVSQSAHGKDLLLREQVREQEFSRRWRAVHGMLGSHQISRKSQALLKSRGLGPALLDPVAGNKGAQYAADFQDTLRILIVRISFTSNRDSNLTTIAPNGDFQLDPLVNPGPLEIDPPPHDKAFYEAHLLGLSEFYKFQSGGRLHIEGRVLPEEPEGSYQVGDVADFGPGEGNFWNLEDLERLVRDMMVAADEGTIADQTANLSDYDDDDPFTYIIFVHAGSDWQSDINGDSPNDIPTFFLTLGEPQALLSTDSDNGSKGLLSECSIIPETANQDGFPGSIAAAFYHEFGHALGLVDVYNTENQTPNAGIWDLMDSGTNLGVTLGAVTADQDTVFVVANGVLPPSLGAWNKWFLGWLNLGEIKGQQLQYRLPAVGVPRDQYNIYDGISGDFDKRYPQALRAGVSPREWFLLENRWVPTGPTETPFLNLSFERDEATGVILYLAGERPQGFWNNSGLYDYFMPAGGVLAWHVNEDRIEQGLASNTINTQGDGLRLIEADGITDIGVLDSYVLGWYGSVRDPFGGYDGFGIPTGNTDLFTTGYPSSRCVDRSLTGFFMSDVAPNVGKRTSVMRFKAGIEPLVDGFPWTMAADDEGQPQALDVESLTPVVLADGRSVLIFASGPGSGAQTSTGSANLFALNGSGFPVWTPTADEPVGSFAALDAALAGPPAQVTYGSGELGLLWTTTEGEIGLTGLDGEPALVWSHPVSNGFTQGAVVLGRDSGSPVVLGTSVTDSVFVLDLATGASLASATVQGQGAVTGPLMVRPGLNSNRCLAPAIIGWYEFDFQTEGDILQVTGIGYPAHPATGRVWGAQLTNGQEDRLWFFDSEGELGAWQFVAGQWSADRLLGLDEAPVCEPAVADIDGDGLNDLVLASSQRLYAFAATGVALQGWPVSLVDLFPLPDSTRIIGPVVLADGTGNMINDVFFQTDGGHLLGLNAKGSLLPEFPFRWGGKGAAGFAVGSSFIPGGGRTLWLASEGGYAGPPRARNLVEGRVSGYQLAPKDAEGGTSEWLGPRGGSTRVGPVGLARDLGDAAPAASEVDVPMVYPNPLGLGPLTIRFYSADDRPANFWVHNLEGEIVLHRELAAVAGHVNENSLDLGKVASGLYVCRLEFSSTSGRTTRTMTLAVER